MSMRARAKVLLTPLGSHIKYQVLGRIVCSRMQEELPNSRTWSRDNLVWLDIFGSERDIGRFLKRNRQVAKVISLYVLGYDPCDHLQ
jgi:hypothetical protein